MKLFDSIKYLIKRDKKDREFVIKIKKPKKVRIKKQKKVKIKKPKKVRIKKQKKVKVKKFKKIRIKKQKKVKVKKPKKVRIKKQKKVKVKKQKKIKIPRELRKFKKIIIKKPKRVIVSREIKKSKVEEVVKKEVIKKGLSKSQKMDNWVEWSSLGFPYKILEGIEEINRDMNLNYSHSYGFKVMFFMYMEGWNRDKTEKYFKVDYFGYEVIYIKNIKV